MAPSARRVLVHAPRPMASPPLAAVRAPCAHCLSPWVVMGLGGLLVVEDASANPLRDLRDEGVAEGGKAVHPSGNPISHSTHVGFSAPPTTEFRGGELRFAWLELPLLLPSCFVGVGKICRSASLTARPSSLPLGPGFRRCPRFGIPCGVGHDPDPLSQVGCPELSSRQARPLRVIPARGQVSENSRYSGSRLSWGITHRPPAGATSGPFRLSRWIFSLSASASAERRCTLASAASRSAWSALTQSSGRIDSANRLAALPIRRQRHASAHRSVASRDFETLPPKRSSIQ